MSKLIKLNKTPNQLELELNDKWKDFHILEHYSISESGIITNLKTGYQLNPSISNSGYKELTLSFYGYQIHYTIHYLVALKYIPNPKNLKSIDHINGNKLDNHYTNLRRCTHQQNIRYASNLTLRKANNIRKFIKQGISIKILAKRYKTSIQTIYDIKYNNSWN